MEFEEKLDATGVEAETVLGDAIDRFRTKMQALDPEFVRHFGEEEPQGTGG